MASLTRLICAIWGHEEYVQFEKNRMYLQCIECGHESPGWTIDARRPVLRLHVQAGERVRPRFDAENGLRPPYGLSHRVRVYGNSIRRSFPFCAPRIHANRRSPSRR